MGLLNYIIIGIEKGVGASYAITGASGGIVVLGECSLDGDINTALIISYKKIINLRQMCWNLTMIR